MYQFCRPCWSGVYVLEDADELLSEAKLRGNRAWALKLLTNPVYVEEYIEEKCVLCQVLKLDSACESTVKKAREKLCDDISFTVHFLVLSDARTVSFYKA